MNIQLIALDMDGTTLADDHVTLPERNRTAIIKAINKGIQVVTATGRMRYRIPESIACIPGTRYAITSNGAAVWDMLENKKLYEKPLSCAKTLDILNHLLPLGAYIELYYNGSCYAHRADDAIWHAFPFAPARRTMMLRNRFLVDDLRSFLLDGEKSIEKINIPYIPPLIKPQMEAAFADLKDIYLTSSIAHNAEINAAGVNKADGLSHLCKMLEILPQEVLAVGDNENDLEMLAFAGYSACPCNGLAACKKVASFITCDNNTGAVGEAISHFITD